jgi:DNA-binding IclR family transcriptional regulator
MPVAATEDGEITAGYASVAATGIDRTGYPAAALGITYRAEAVTAEQVDALAEAVRDAAAALSARLQGRS